ncbi:MAG: hypothetical protein J0H93_05145 [Chlamydiales bacterium]|nr:hypothetical protein [Chlamydiales bacterium]
MNMFKKLLTIIFLTPSLLIAYIDEPYHETAFIGPAHTFYGLSYYSYYHTKHFWDSQGKRLPSFNPFTRKSYRLDMEYTLSSSQSVFVKGGYTMVEERLNGNSRGIEDPEASWQTLLYADTRSALSGKLTLIIPVGPKKSCVRFGQWGGEIKVLYSKIFDHWKIPFWIDMGLGYRLYGGFPSDQIRASLSIGWKGTARFWLISSSQLYYGVGNGKKDANQNNICFHPNFRLLTSQVQAIYQMFDCLAFNIGGYLHLWGENIGAGGGFYAGSWILF